MHFSETLLRVGRYCGWDREARNGLMDVEMGGWRRGYVIVQYVIEELVCA
jgi:hypothetical protein